MTRNRRCGGDSRGYGGESGGYGGDSSNRALTPPSRRVSPPSGRFRDRGSGHSPPRRRYHTDVDGVERRGGGYLRREYGRHGDPVSRDYDHRNYSRGDKGSGREYDVNSRSGDRGNDRVYDRNFSRGDGGGSRGNDRPYEQNFSHGDGGGDDRAYEQHFSLGDGGGRRDDRAYERHFSRGDGGGRHYDRACEQHFSRGDGGGRGDDQAYEQNFNRGDRNDDGSFSRGGIRVSSYDFCDRDRTRDDGHLQNLYQSNGSGEYSRALYGVSQGTSSKFQWDHLSDETHNGFKSNLGHLVGGSGTRGDLKYDSQINKFLDKGCDGLVVDGNPAMMEAERGRDYSSSSYPMNISFSSKSYSHADAIGTGMAISSRYSSSSLQKDEDFHCQDNLQVEKLVAAGPTIRDPLARESHKDKSLHYPSIDADYTVSSSWYKEDISSSLTNTSGMMTNTNGYDVFGEKSRTRSAKDNKGRYGDFKSYSQFYLGTAEWGNFRDYAYPRVGSGEGVTLPSFTKTHRNIQGIGEDYSHHDMSRLDAVDHVGVKVDSSSHEKYMSGSETLDRCYTPLKQSMTDHYDAHQSLHAKRMDVDDQGYRGLQPRYERGSYCGPGSPNLGERNHDDDMAQPRYERDSYYGPGSSNLGEYSHDVDMAGNPRFVQRQSDIFLSSQFDLHLEDIDSRSQENFMMKSASFSKPYSHRLKRKRVETQFGDHVSKNCVLGDAGEPWSDNGDPIVSSKSFRVGYSKYGKYRRASNMLAHNQSPSRTISFSSSRHLRKSNVSGTRDIKKRLGPVAQKIHVSQRLMNKYKPLKKQLRPGLPRNHVTLPWLKDRSAPRLRSTQDDSGGNVHDQGEDTHEDNTTPAKPEPPENSEDFKQLVKIAFFKCVKQLNETAAKRRKYKEQGYAGSLKCIICRSEEEFVGTESLATHAVTCENFGLKSQHLGFHKALCALMGWKSAEKLGSTWLRETLSDEENMALKEDLILWPPVVIILNSTIGNKNPDQQVAVSIEEIEAKLRDMGFGDKTKVYRGKPANQSIMVVEFTGTLSGLQEAERLHMFFAGKNHGRAEFLDVKSWSSRSHGGEAESGPVHKVDDILYGYLGIAEDLDKLDFDAKRRRLVKSKKEIEDIAQAPIKIL